MFDPPSMQPYMTYPTSVVNTEYNQVSVLLKFVLSFSFSLSLSPSQNLALQAAEESIVLLQNDGTCYILYYITNTFYLLYNISLYTGTLPLSVTQHHTVALIGPNAEATTTMQGNYHVRRLLWDRKGKSR